MSIVQKKWRETTVLYCAPTFHMESMWNGYIPWNPYGIHMEYVLSFKSSTLHSIWNPYGSHGIHMESMNSIWNGQIPHGIHMESGLKL
jgi:hypothetical protein